METTLAVVAADAELERAREERWREEERRVDELAALSAHLSAATARWLELVWELCEAGSDDPARFVAFRCGITVREAREYLRVAEALQGLPATRAAFARGELTLTKVRALTRVATASSEEGLLELAGALTASQLERALRAFRRVAVEEARETHELEYVDYFFGDDGALFLRARLAAEDGTLLMKALEAARERVVERRREERRAAAEGVERAPRRRRFRSSRRARCESMRCSSSPRHRSRAERVARARMRGSSSMLTLPRSRMTAAAAPSSKTAL